MPKGRKKVSEGEVDTIEVSSEDSQSSDEAPEITGVYSRGYLKGRVRYLVSTESSTKHKWIFEEELDKNLVENFNTQLEEQCRETLARTLETKMLEARTQVYNQNPPHKNSKLFSKLKVRQADLQKDTPVKILGHQVINGDLTYLVLFHNSSREVPLAKSIPEKELVNIAPELLD
mmetsp:Transcript_16267/g.23546  ORF Transcript_16267/g.23546 Transcript_16267/m.23546 type:complete len:175 (+) Transcript_16267:46-570(+)